MPATLRIGQQARALTSVVLGRGGTRLLTFGWTSDSPRVARITGEGMVTAVSNGRAVLSVTYGGERWGREIRVVPDFEGYWTGSYRITRCTWSPEFLPSWCVGLQNASGPITFTLSQQDGFVSGSFVAEGVNYPGFVAAITEGGLLEMTSRGVTAPARLTTASWSLSSPRPRHVEGVLVWLRTGIGGLNGYGLAEGVVSADR